MIPSLGVEMAMLPNVWQSFFPRQFDRQPPWHSRRRRASIARAAELIEDIAPQSAMAWVGRGGDSNWDIPAYWSTGIAPGPTDDCLHGKEPVS